MEIKSLTEEQIKKMCAGLDVYKAKNRLQLLCPEIAQKIDIEFVESKYRRFIVTDISFTNGIVKLVATSNNPIRHLPSIYQENDFLRHYLMIFQHIMNETAISLDNLDNIFRPMETPAKFLPVLADWFGVEFDLLGDEQIARKVLQYTIPLYRYRGTKIGLKALLYLVSGIVPEIIEGELPFDALSIDGNTDISSTILNTQDGINLVSVYFPVLSEEFSPDMIKRLYKLIQNEKPIDSECYLFFKKPEVKKRKTTVITTDIVEMGEDGIEF